MTFDDFSFDFDKDSMQADLNRVLRTKDDSANQRANKYLTLPKGECSVAVRLLPANTPKGKRTPYGSTRLHYVNDRGYHCLRESIEGKWAGDCPICNFYNFLYRKADELEESDKKAAEAIRNRARNYKPVERYYYNVIVRRWPDPATGQMSTNVGPLIFPVGKNLHGRILRAYLGNKKFNQKPIGNIFHPLTGRDLNVIKKISRGHGMEYPDYDESTFEEESVLGSEEQMREWLNKMWDLDEDRQRELKSYDEMQHVVDILQGKAKADEEAPEYDLPPDLMDLAGDSSKTSVVVEKKYTEVVPPKALTSNEDDVPFEVSADSGVDEKWLEDIKKKINI